MKNSKKAAKKNAEAEEKTKRTLAVSAKAVALKLGMPEQEAEMAVCNLPAMMTDAEYTKVLKEKKIASRPVDVITGNLYMGNTYRGDRVGTHSATRVTFNNVIYINKKDGRPTRIDPEMLDDLLQREDLPIPNENFFWNARARLRFLVGDPFVVSPEKFDKKTSKDFSDLPESLKVGGRSGQLKTYYVPFYFSAHPKPRAGKDAGWTEVQTELYRWAEVLKKGQFNESRHCGPSNNPRIRSSRNICLYGLCGRREKYNDGGTSVSKTVVTGAWFVQYIGHFENDEWVDEGSHMVLTHPALIERGLATYFAPRVQPAVYKTLVGNALILSNKFMEGALEKATDAKSATPGAATAAVPVKKPAPVKSAYGPPAHGTGGKSNGNGDGSKASIGELMATKGVEVKLPDPPAPAPADPPPADGQGAPAS